MPNARDLARQLFDAAVQAADPAMALREALAHSPFPVPKSGQTYLLAIGKGAPAMMREALNQVQGPHQALAVCHHDNQETAGEARVLRGGHPVPDEAGLTAAKEVMAFVAQATAEDQVIVLVSGGASAILPAPVAGVTLEDKMVLHKALLGAGLDIVKMNLVRQQASEIKGGGLLCAAAPAPVTGYILSDVVNDDLRVVSSGPTVGPIGTRSQARDILQTAQIWDDLPASLKSTFEQPDLALETPDAKNHLIGSNRKSVLAMADAVPQGWSVEVDATPLEGDVSDAAAYVVRQMQQALPGSILLFGGETTVVLKGTGQGGRNQELAVRVAESLQSKERLGENGWVFLSGGTDGRDGPTDAAGGLVDEASFARMKAVGLDLPKHLANNDSYALLEAAGDLLLTEATGTNVADVQVAILPKH